MKPRSTSELTRLHLIVHSILEPANLFNFTKLKSSPSSNFFLSTSRNLLCNPDTYQIFSAPNYNVNKFTRSLQILKIELGQRGGFVEGRSFGMLHSDGLWTIVDEENNKAPGVAIVNNDVFKFGNQVIRTQLYNPSDTSGTNANILSLYQHLFPDYDFSAEQNYNFLKRFTEITHNPAIEASVRGSAVSMGGNTPVCRICLDNEKSARPFARDICKCSESMPVHGECLRDWIKMKCKPIKCKNYIYYDLAHLSCDVCKEQYPPFLDIDGDKKPILKLEFSKSAPFSILEIYKIDGNHIKHLVVLDLSQKMEERYTIGSSPQCTIQFKSDLIKDFHANLVTRGDRMYMFNLDKKFGTLRKIRGKVPLDSLQMKVLISGKFSFLFHVFLKGPCGCIKKGLRAIKSDPLDTDERLQETDFVAVKKDLRSFAKNGPQRVEGPVTTDVSIHSEVELPNRQNNSMGERANSSRRNPTAVSQNYVSENPKKPRDDISQFQILKQGKQQAPNRSPSPAHKAPQGITDKEFEDIQNKKMKRMIQGAKRVENDFAPTLLEGAPIPRPTIGTSELYFNSDVNYHFE